LSFSGTTQSQYNADYLYREEERSVADEGILRLSIRKQDKFSGEDGGFSFYEQCRFGFMNFVLNFQDLGLSSDFISFICSLGVDKFLLLLGFLGHNLGCMPCIFP